MLFTLNTQLPTITGAAGSDDITISALGGSADLLSVARSHAKAARFRK